MLVLVDTNAWIAGIRQKIDIFEELSHLFGEYELLIPSFIVEELEKVAKNTKKGRDKMAARLALELIKSSKIKILQIKPKTKDIDSEIVDLIKDIRAKNEKIALITNDAFLQSRAKKEGVIVCAWKKERFLDFV